MRHGGPGDRDDADKGIQATAVPAVAPALLLSGHKSGESPR